jgi:hypothetical protein
MANSLDNAVDTIRQCSVKRASYTIALATLSSSAILLFTVGAWASLIPIAFLFGWTQLASPCGIAMVGALTPALSASRRAWIGAVFAYTVAGFVSASTVGAVLGWLGTFVYAAVPPLIRLCPLLGISALLAAREGGLLSFPLPQRRRASVKEWRRFGLVDSAAMWGFHIGLGFGTWTNYGGPLLLIGGIALGMGNHTGARNGVLIMGSYWFGRAISAWITPLLGRRDIALISNILTTFPDQRKIHAIALTWATAVVLFAAIAL